MNRYVNCGNGTVTDLVTGLTWLKNPNCFGNQRYVEAQQDVAALAEVSVG